MPLCHILTPSDTETGTELPVSEKLHFLSLPNQIRLCLPPLSIVPSLVLRHFLCLRIDLHSCSPLEVDNDDIPG